jgi:hypothetical protein
MATRIVSPTAGGSGDGSLGNPWTCDQARRLADAGDTVQLRGGAYPFSSTHTYDNSGGGGQQGTATSWITWENYPSETPVITRRMYLHYAQYLKFSGISFTSDGESWVLGGLSDAGADHVTFESCTFNNTEIGTAYTGLLLHDSKFVTLDGCTWQDWLLGDMVKFYRATRLLVKDNNFNVARGGHALLAIHDSKRSVVHRNYFRNNIDRALHCTERPDNSAEDLIVQWNLFVDCDWNGTDAHPFDGTDQEFERGANQSARFVVPRGIFRFNIIALSNIGKDHDWAAGIDISYYDSSRDSHDLRCYHNTIYNGTKSGVGITTNPVETGGVFNDLGMRFQNNIVAQNDEYGIRLGHADLEWRTYKFTYNQIADNRKTSLIYIAGESPNAMSVADAESAYPQVFSDNITGYPSFKDDSILAAINASPASYGIADIDDIFYKLTLSVGSPGKAAASHLATVTQAGTGVTTINLSDAVPFTDGWGLVARDEIYIGANLVEVVDRPTNTTIVVNTAIDVSVGDKVYHSVVGSDTPDMGVPTTTLETTDPVVPPEPPPDLGTDDTTPEEDEDDIGSQPPTGIAITDATVADLLFPNANPILQKPGLRVNLSGVATKSPVLSGLGGTLQIILGNGERLLSWRIYSENFEKQLTIVDPDNPTVDIVFGTDTDTGVLAIRNYVEWITNYGKTVRQLWVKDLPAAGSLYIGNQEAQSANAQFAIASGEPLSFGINILPAFADEFFSIHEYVGNRYANTLRNWGGALTAEVSIDGAPIISERYIGEIHGYYWDAPGSGIHPVLVRLRAAESSPYYVDIDGNIEIAYL